MVLSEKTLYSLGRRCVYIFSRRKAKKEIPVKELIVSRIETALGLPSRPEQPMLERIRVLLNTVERIVFSQSEGSEYEQQLHQQRQQQARGLYDDLWRVLRFIAVHDG